MTRPDITLIPLGSEFDLSAGKQLQARLNDSPQTDPVVVDLSELRGINPIVLGILFGSAKGGRRISLVVPDQPRRTLLARIRAEVLLDIHTSIDAALEALGPDVALG